MMDNLVITAVALAFLVPLAIYVIGRLAPRLSQFAYPVMGTFCLVIAATFLTSVAWYFIETGQLVSPGKYRPSTIIDPSAPMAERIFVGAFNLGIGSMLAVVGVGMLRVGRKSDRKSSK